MSTPQHVSSNKLVQTHNLPSLVHRSNVSNMPAQSMTIIQINASQFLNHTYTEADIRTENIPTLSKDSLTWIHLVGITDNDQLHQLLQPFNIHELAMEDILSRKQRPKIEDYGHYLFVAARIFVYKKQKLQYNQIYLIIGQNYIITFQFEPLGLLHIIRKYIQHNYSSIYSKGIDFLAYSLLDRIVDDYFVTVDEFDNRVEGLDKRLFSNSNKNLLMSIHQLKRDAISLRRTLSPIRDIIGRIVHNEFSLFSQDIHVYLLDVYDHTQQLMETLDSARDTVTGMMDVHLSYQSNHLNEQMRMLTVITIIVMPLNVLTGIYGMNFDNIPELHWHYGYYIVLGLMATIIVSLLIYFYRRHWL
ncbi:magnesium/cobalt transporter CorA [Snodgrassella sp. B3088]|uniref:magnesium/cobalt transporter CorA n=1 Tax=Snodgrassella sp. B3088 TaxID=2818038 RepID=UPI002269EB63|nr:magnesium/cobalt transporter CorA [Snodgrassella sp. B3088]MCX8747926.1 magnesium/cobalt transporter CorA [Snodgrassella sp. B3088]